MNILAEIAARTKLRAAEDKKRLPLAEVRRLAESAAKGAASFAFERALRGEDISFICEVKRASPSKGLIARDFPYLDIARDYQAAGAAAVSCLTEPYWFKGEDRCLCEISAALSIPVLRKDFTVDEYMVYAARALGASAVLLIVSILDDARLLSYRQLADELGLSSLVEAHDETEVERALKVGARVVGVNNRDLRTFQVDMEVSRRLRPLVPSEVVFVSESGVNGAEDIQKLRRYGVDAVLIGETLMRAADRRAMLDELRDGAR